MRPFILFQLTHRFMAWFYIKLFISHSWINLILSYSTDHFPQQKNPLRALCRWLQAWIFQGAAVIGNMPVGCGSGSLLLGSPQQEVLGRRVSWSSAVSLAVVQPAELGAVLCGSACSTTTPESSQRGLSCLPSPMLILLFHGDCCPCCSVHSWQQAIAIH